MSEQICVIGYYDQGQMAWKKKKYLLAARLFRLCALYYENCELGMYDRDVQRQGTSALYKYEKCRRKLSHQEQEMLDTEEAKYIPKDGSYFIWSWRDFTKEERDRIDERELKLLYEESNKRRSAMSIITSLKTFVQRHLTRCN